MKSLRIFKFGFLATSVLCFCIFLVSNSPDAVMNIRFKLSYFVYFAIAVVLIKNTIKKRDPLSLVLAACCFGAGYFLFHFCSMFAPDTIVGLPQFGCGVVALSFIWSGIYSVVKGGVFRMIGFGLFSAGMVFAIMYILAFTMDIKINGAESVMALMLCFLMPIAIGVFTAVLFQIADGRTGVYIFSIFVGLVWIGSFWIAVVATNNVLYGGCWPITPIGRACELNSSKPVVENSTGSLKPEVIDTPRPVVVGSPALIEVTFMPKGGSLCGTLGMTPREALSFAKDNHMKYWYKDNILYVLVFQNQKFKKDGSSWKIVQ